MDHRLTEEMATALSRIALGHVTREYPNKLDHVLTGPADLQAPRDLHPVFFGSFDWHSCVHGYWMLARLLRACPDMHTAPAIRTLFDAQIVPTKVAAECRYLRRPEARGFERPYGWAWLLKLAAELQGHATAPWGAALTPLATLVADRLKAFLPLAIYPIRAGSHANTAFALALAMDYAHAAGDHGLAATLEAKARAWYGGDIECQAWEPGGDDFLSPALIEAECLRRCLSATDFAAWFDRFLPRLVDREPGTLFTPVVTTDRTDGKLAHLDGLNLSRAWCWRAVGSALPATDPRHAIAQAAATAHLDAGLPHVAGDYMGEHWLASFAVLALDG